MTAKELKTIANRLRLDVMEMIHSSGDGHPAPSMSIADMLALLYFDVMHINPQEPRLKDRDRLIVSKGHACPTQYAALARRGFFPVSELAGLRTLCSMLQGHPDMNKTPGIDMVSGSLGNGVSIGVGMAAGLLMQGFDSYVYIIIGDGEQQEGVIWEGAMAAATHHLGHLIVLADCNNYQSGGKVTELSSLYPTIKKWDAFHWHTQTVDGHDIDALRHAIENAKAVTDRPSYIECITTKGKGIPFMENNNAWHKRTPAKEEVALAKEALGGDAL